MELDTFIARWAASGGAERANYGQFLSELRRVLGASEPEPTRTDAADSGYVLERTVQKVQDDEVGTLRH